jgi:hypothetical protein
LNPFHHPFILSGGFYSRRRVNSGVRLLLVRYRTEICGKKI